VRNEKGLFKGGKGDKDGVPIAIVDPNGLWLGNAAAPPDRATKRSQRGDA